MRRAIKDVAIVSSSKRGIVVCSGIDFVYIPMTSEEIEFLNLKHTTHACWRISISKEGGNQS